MRLKWLKNVHGQLRVYENGNNRGSYRRLSRGLWVVVLETNGSRVMTVFPTTEKECRKVITQWVSLPF